MTKLATRAEVDRAYQFMLTQFANGPIDWECKPWKAKRTDRQNAALFGHAYRVIAEETGLSGRKELEDLHEGFCRRFYGEREVTVLGESRKYPVRTTTTDENGKRDVINTGEFSAFYGDVERIAAECGIFIPSPDPRWFLDA